MKRQGLTLGLLSITGQVCLLREMVSSLNGDELFIGTALFGWLIAVAVGAWLGGRRWHIKRQGILFVLGALLIPIMIVAVRFSPLMVTSVAGETIPFMKAAMISIIAMFPVGIISGCLFPLITRDIVFPASEGIITVYLFEGIGAFIGGLLITVSTGFIPSNFAVASVLAVILVGICFFEASKLRKIIVGIVTILIALTVAGVAWYADFHLDTIRYAKLELINSFDTHYGRQVILRRETSTIILTQNSIEDIIPDTARAEDELVIPLLYNPRATRILYIGGLGINTASLAQAFPSMTFTTIDPRRLYVRKMRLKSKGLSIIDVIDDDPAAYLSEKSVTAAYDIIILASGSPDSYTYSRFITPDFLKSAGRWLADGGILCLPTSYDTERFIAPEKKPMLSILYRTLQSAFPHVAVWPGTATVFLASQNELLDLSVDDLVSRITELAYTPEYINDYFLYDRLNDMRTNRLQAALNKYDMINTAEKPILTHYQAMYRSTAYPMDRGLLNGILGHHAWLLIFPFGLIAFFLSLVRPSRHNEIYSVFLFFTAGLVSLSLELISFYVYQTRAGSLYGEMAVLIGAFMLGLALGTYYAHRQRGGGQEYPGLILILAAAIIYFVLHDRIGSETLLVFHGLFLLVTAIATGTLFVGATNRMYGDSVGGNRGVGYAWELIGSAIGALVTMTVLLPVIGLTWLLVSLIIIIVLALAGAIMTGRRPRIA